MHVVALLAEGVGRNRTSKNTSMNKSVALLAEGVGRNKVDWYSRAGRWVALLTEGVGRNWYLAWPDLEMAASPSSRRAWVEIPPTSCPPATPTVALLAEGVGRNQLLE